MDTETMKCKLFDEVESWTTQEEIYESLGALDRGGEYLMEKMQRAAMQIEHEEY